MDYDVLVIGSGPGGYVSAIRASQLGLKTGVIEKESLGGVCLNWGCIPTKSLLKSAQVYEDIKNAKDYGINVSEVSPDFPKIIERSRNVAEGMSKGVEFLFKKNKIDKITGAGKFVDKNTVEVDNEGDTKQYSANHIIIATGGRSKELSNVPIDGEKIIGYRKAMTLEKLPESMLIIGSGAIGSEFAYLYASLGTKVTLVEYLPSVLPLEDADVSKQIGRSFKKKKITVLTNSTVTSVDTSGNKPKAVVKGKKGEENYEADVVLSAVGVTPNTENIGLDTIGVDTRDNGTIKVDEFYRTNVEGVYAIGDIIPGPALAHVASHEGITCVEKIAGEEPLPVDYNNVPSNVYTVPEVASVGMTEKQAKDAGYEVKVGNFPFTASGKASAGGSKEGFVKVLYDAKYGELLGAHMVGDHVTEMISEIVVARKLETTGKEIIKSIHPHPTMSEAIMEASAAAYDEVIHI